MRLIDADAFERNMQNEWEQNEISNGEWIRFREMINEEPTIEKCKTGRWIPCSERLPSDDEEVIATIYDDSGDSAFSYTTVGWHFKGLWVVDNERCSKVVAWMPLPKPYKEDTK